jgi:hypothetical protein
MAELVTTPLDGVRYKQGYMAGLADILAGFKENFQ